MNTRLLKASQSLLFIRVRMEPSIFDDFQRKCEDEGLNMSVVLKACIDAYIDNSLVYENGKLRMN